MKDIYVTVFDTIIELASRKFSLQLLNDLLHFYKIICIKF